MSPVVDALAAAVADRDRARGLAVALEQELAALAAELPDDEQRYRQALVRLREAWTGGATCARCDRPPAAVHVALVCAEHDPMRPAAAGDRAWPPSEEAAP